MGSFDAQINLTAFGWQGRYTTRDGTLVAVHGWEGHTISFDGVAVPDAIRWDTLGNCRVAMNEMGEDIEGELSHLDLMHSVKGSGNQMDQMEVIGCPVCEGLLGAMGESVEKGEVAVQTGGVGLVMVSSEEGVEGGDNNPVELAPDKDVIDVQEVFRQIESLGDHLL